MKIATLLKTHSFIKKETLAKAFSCKFCEIFYNTFLQNTSEQLLLILEIISPNHLLSEALEENIKE